MLIRKARLEDIDDCVAMSHIPEFTYLSEATDKTAKRYFKEFFEKGIFLIAEERKQVIGFIGGEFMLGKFVWVEAITVKKEYRGKGVGKKLFNAFRNLLKARGIKYLYLMAPQFNKNTIAFYKKVGLKQGKEFIEFSGKI